MLAFLPLVSSCGQNRQAESARAFSVGLGYFGEQKYPAAEIEFRKATEANPKAWAAHFYLALTDLGLHRWQGAYSELKTVTQLQPSMMAARLDLAELLLRGGRPDDARVAAQEVLRAQPNNLRALTVLTKIEMASQEFTDAGRTLAKARALSPDNSTLWLASGMASVGAKDFENAESQFREAIRLDPASAEGYEDLANLFRLSHQDVQVEPLLAEGLRQNPKSLRLELALADFYYQQGRTQDIIQLFRRLEAHSWDFPNLNERLGDFWISRNEVALAQAEYQSAFLRNPTLEIRKKLINADVTMGRWDEAETLNWPILAKHPGDIEARAFAGALLYLRGNFSAATQQLRSVLKDEPRSLFAQYYLGLALMSAGEQRQAQIAFEQCVSQDQNFAPAFEKLSRLSMAREDWLTAIAYARKVITLTPSQPGGHELLAQAHLGNGDVNGALQALEPLAATQQKAPAYHQLLGSAYLQAGRTDAGLKEFETALTLAPDQPAILNGFVDEVSARGNFDGAIRQIQSLAGRKNNPAYEDALARLYLKKGDYSSAEAAAEEALQMNHQDLGGHIYWGAAEADRHQPEKALASYEQVIHRYPRFVPAYLLAGELCLKQGKLNKAGEYYAAALRLDPNSARAEHGEVQTWVEQGRNLEEAMAVAQGLERYYPSDDSLHDTIAWIFYHQGRPSLALDILKEIVQRHPTNSLYLFHLGMVYAKLGQVPLSHQALEASLRSGLDSSRWEAMARSALAETSWRPTKAGEFSASQ